MYLTMCNISPTLISQCALYVSTLHSTWFSASSILGYQEELNKLRREKSLERSKVNQYRQLERMFFEKRSEREKLVTRLKLLRAQVEELQSPQKEGQFLFLSIFVYL